MDRGVRSAVGAARGWRGPAIASTAFALSLLVVEGGARLWLGDEFVPGIVTDAPMSVCVVRDPDLGWRCRPGFRMRAIGPSLNSPVFRYSVALNRRGLRDVDHPYEKPHGTIRIACLGDSFVWGWGVDDGETFADRLERELGPEVEVVNLGVPGYSTDQELLCFLEEGKKYRPDLVLLGYVLNDAEGNLRSANHGLPKPALVRAGGGWRLVRPNGEGTESKWSGWRLWLLARSAAWQLVRPPIVTGTVPNRRLCATPSAELERAFRTTEYQVYSPGEIGALTRAVSDESSPTFAALSLLRQACLDVGAPLIAFSLPHLHDQYLQNPWLRPGAKARSALESGVPFRTDLTEHLEAAGCRLGFRVLSVDGALLEAVRRGRNLNVGDGHLDAEGHRVIGEELARQLLPAVEALRAGGEGAR